MEPYNDYEWEQCGDSPQIIPPAALTVEDVIGMITKSQLDETYQQGINEGFRLAQQKPTDPMQVMLAMQMANMQPKRDAQTSLLVVLFAICLLAGVAYYTGAIDKALSVVNRWGVSEPINGTGAQSAPIGGEAKAEAQYSYAGDTGDFDYYDSLIAYFAAKDGRFDPRIMRGIIGVESTGIRYGDPFNPNAYNATSAAAGMCQFMPEMQAKYGITNPYDPVQLLPACADFIGDINGLPIVQKDVPENIIKVFYHGQPRATCGNALCADTGEDLVYYERWHKHDNLFKGYPERFGWIVMPYADDTGKFVDAGFHGSVAGWWGRDTASSGMCGAKLVSPITGWVVYAGTDGYIGPYAIDGDGDGKKDENPLIIIQAGAMKVKMMHGDYSVKVGDYVTAGVTEVGAENKTGNTVPNATYQCHTHIILELDNKVVDFEQYVMQ